MKAFLIALGATILFFTTLSSSGFCYSKFKYLERAELVKEAAHTNAQNCWIEGAPFDMTSVDHFANALLFFKRIYEIDCVSPNYLSIISVTSCGEIVDTSGIDISDSNRYQKKIKAFWDSIEK